LIVFELARVAKSFGTDEVLRDVSLTLKSGERIGLVGVNGSGKTTLLRILCGELQADEGQVSFARGIRVGYLTQIYQPASGASVLQEAQEALRGLSAMEQKLRALERQMGEQLSEEELQPVLSEYARLMELFEREGGYEASSQVLGVLGGLGFGQERHQQEAATLSGGELTRLNLARLLLQKPDLLLLDEPTNHLDMTTMAWLESYLMEYPGSVMLVSHDRYFLNAVCTGMAELLFGTLETYHGNYTSYLKQRAERHAARDKAWQLQQKEIMRQRAIIARFRSFNREKSIRAAESREKALARMELVERPEEEKQIMFRFETKRLLGDIALEAEGLRKAFGERVLFDGLDLKLRGGDRVALIGPNGIGKTTLLRCLMGREPLDAGELRYGPKAQVGYFDQRQQDLDLNKDVLNEVWDAFPALNQSQVRGALGLFLFSADDVFVPLRLLSGGERSRVSLTKLMLRRDNFLLLDEPTNHLDADSREALEQALDGYEGTILAVSHDRYFINRFANRVLVMGPEGLTAYEGNYDDYQAQLRRLEEGTDDQAPERTRTQIARERRAEREQAAQIEALRQALEQAELAVQQAEHQLAQGLSQLEDPAIYADPEKASLQAARNRQLQARVERQYERWEQADRHLEDALARLEQGE